MINIKNLRKDRPNTEFDIRVDRSSVLGNPFYLNKQTTRKEVIENYKQWLYREFFVNHNQPIKDELLRIAKLANHNNINLFCWCYPLPCHAEVIRDFIITHLIEAKHASFVCPLQLQHIEIGEN